MYITFFFFFFFFFFFEFKKKKVSFKEKKLNYIFCGGEEEVTEETF